MPQQVIDYVSPKTGKKHSFDWNKPTPPTPQDFKSLEDWVSSQEKDFTPENKPTEVTTSIKKPAWQEAADIINAPREKKVEKPGKSHGALIDNVWNAGKRVGDTVSGYMDQVLGPLGKNYNFNELANQGQEQLKHPVNTLANSVLPIDSTIEDIKSGNYGGAVANVGMFGAGLYGLGKGIRKGLTKGIPPELLPNEPKVNVIPKVADPFIELPKASKKEWNFDEGTRHMPEQFASGRNYGVENLGEQVDLSVLNNEDILLGKAKGREVKTRDWLESNPNMSHVPNRLRPEAPNVTLLKNLSEGAPKKGGVIPKKKIEFINEADWEAQNPKKKLPDVENPVKVETKVIPDEEIKPAEIKGKRGLVSSLKFMQANPVLKDITDKWIKRRDSSELVGRDIRNNFAGIKDIPKEDIVQFQNDIAAGKHPDVREFFDKQFEDLKARGIELDRKDNYLPQLWDNTAEEISNAFGDKTMRAKAPFQYQSVFRDYQHGIEKGLTPKMSPVQLVEYYGKRANKLVADHEALTQLKAEGYLSPTRKTGMVEIDPNLGSFKGYYTHPDVKHVIENYLKSSDDGGLSSALAKGTGKVASMQLSAGLIPGKPIATYHGMNMTSRGFMEGGVKRAFTALKAGWNPVKAGMSIDAELPQITEASQKYGFKIGVENPSAQHDTFFTPGKSKAGDIANKGFATQHKYFEKPLFEQMIPKLKWESWKDNFAKFQKAGLSEAEAGAKATQITEDFYSGKNTNLIYRNKSFTKAARILSLAPDWYESSVALGAKIPKAFVELVKDPSNPVAQTYAKAGGRILGTYVVANLLQKSLTGKFMWENPAGHEFDIEMGESGGKSRRFKLFGSAADMIKIPLQAAIGIKEGTGEPISNSVRSKFSPLLSAGYTGITGEDYKGEPNLFKTKDNFGRPIPFGTRLTNTLSQGANFATPPQISTPIDFALGKINGEEAISKLGELPFSYGNKRKVKTPSPFR